MPCCWLRPGGWLKTCRPSSKYDHQPPDTTYHTYHGGRQAGRRAGSEGWGGGLPDGLLSICAGGVEQAPGRAGANLTAQQVQRARCRAAPPYLRRRVETGDMEMPSMQVIGGAGQQEGEEEEEGSAVSSSGTRTREVLRWVVEGMRDDPWADLMHLLGPTTHSHANTISSSRTTTGR